MKPVGTRKAGQRFEEDDSPATQEAAVSVGRSAERAQQVTPANKGSGGASSDPANYQRGGKYNSGAEIGNQQASIDTTFTDRIKSGADSFDDSTTANQNRLNRQINNFRDGADYYKDTSSIAQGAIDRAEKNRYINTEALDNRINNREMYNNARSDVTRSEIFGDIWKNQYIDDDLERQPWQSAEPGKPVEDPDWEDMYNKYTDFD